jgi:flagellar biosynthetic protein FliP
MQKAPPNTVLISIALFLNFFTMAPTIEAVNIQTFQPFMDNTLAAGPAVDKALHPIRDFMVRQMVSTS